MNKEAQSILFNVFPMQAINMRQSPISNKEAQSLYEIWKSDKDEYGKFIVPDKIDPMQVASLKSKGVIRSPQSRFPSVMVSATKRSVDITDMGKQVIRNIILYTEKSALEKSSESINYERIYVAMQNNILKESGQKLAGRFEFPEMLRHMTSWLQRAMENPEPKAGTQCDICDAPLDPETIRRGRSSLCGRCKHNVRPERAMESREPMPMQEET